MDYSIFIINKYFNSIEHSSSKIANVKNFIIGLSHNSIVISVNENLIHHYIYKVL